MVEEYRFIPVKTGMNTIRFDWNQSDVVSESIQLDFQQDSPSVQIRKRILDETQSSITWKIYSENPKQLQLRILYVLNNIRKHPSYSVTLNDRDKTLSLNELFLLENRSGVDFQNSWINLGKGNMIDSLWKSNERKRISVYEVDEIPVKKYVKFNHRHFSSTPGEKGKPLPVYYEFRNQSRSGLGDKLLGEGKVRIYQERKNGSKIFVGEDRFGESISVGETIPMQVGTTRDIKAKRIVKHKEQINQIRDNFGNLQLYDQLEVIQYELKNFSSSTQKIKVVDSIPGEWTMERSTHDYRKINYRKIRFDEPVQSQESETIQIEYIRRNIKP